MRWRAAAGRWPYWKVSASPGTRPDETSGFVLPGFGQSVDKIVERVWNGSCAELGTLSQGGVDYVRQTIAESKMQGIELSEGWLHVSKTDRARQVSDDADVLRSLGADIEVWPERLVRSKLKSDRYFQAIHFPTAFNIHPLNYAAGLCEACGRRRRADFRRDASAVDRSGRRAQTHRDREWPHPRRAYRAGRQCSSWWTDAGDCADADAGAHLRHRDEAARRRLCRKRSTIQAR